MRILGSTPARARFWYTGLRGRNFARSLAFYERFGFREVSRGRMSHGGGWIHLRFPGASHRLELNYHPPTSRFWTPFRPGTECDHYGFCAADLNAWRRRGRRAGATLVADFPEGP